MPQYKPGLKDESGAVRKALENPIGTKRLKEIARGKKNAVIVVNDITRPTASYKFLPALLLGGGGENRYGTHRTPPGRRLFRGRKSILPGIASLATLKQHHGFNLRSDKLAMGWVEGNKFHENALEAARMAKVGFILNTVQNQHKEITQVVAGDVEKAWLFSKCLKRADLILVSKKIDDKTLKEMFTQRADTVEEAVAMALAKPGENAKIILMKNGSDMIPRFEGKPENA